ncbi:MAG: YggT family protein [Pseudomonadota bacterium]
MLADISEFLLRSLTHLIIIVVLLRLYLQLVRANFRNPLAQAIVQLTSPLVVPVRRFVPPIGQIDTATLLVAYAIQVVLLAALFLLRGIDVSGAIFGLAVFELARLSLQLFIFAIIINIVLSWVAPGTYNPASQLIDELVRPILTPFRRWIPPVSGFDFSPIGALLALGVGTIIVDNLSAWFLY